MRLASLPLRQLSRCLAAILCSLASLFLLMQTVAARVNPDPPVVSIEVYPRAIESPFTWLVTVSIESGVSQAPALYSRWVNTIFGVPILTTTIYNPVVLPGDATNITASVHNGQFSIVGTTIYYTLFLGSADMGWSYRTLQKVIRTGNEYRLDQRASSNYPFHQISTVFYSTPLQYVGSITFTPQLVTSNTLQWDLAVPYDSNLFPGYVFQISSWLVDPGLPQPDLSFTGAALAIDNNLNPPIAHLTATLRNNTSMTSTIAFLEFYDRASPSAPPSGPLDHNGGWCGSGAAPACPVLVNFSNPVPALAPGRSVTITTNYSLTNPGLRDFYWQIDTFGGAKGLNVESNEGNNVYTLTQGVTIDYLESVVISGPLTGAANTPLAFNAQVTPSLAVNRPLTYTWSPAPLSGQGTANVTYTWSTGDVRAITVTASNARQVTVTDTHFISIGVPLTGATISGPITVSQNIPHAYQVSAEPVTATAPFDYFWDPEPDQGQATDVVTYTVTDLGEHLVNAYVNNPIGPPVTGTYRIVSVPPLTMVTIDGPSTGLPLTTLTFTATTQPVDAAPPLNYVWSPAPDSGQGTAQAQYQWVSFGTQEISVTVSNDSGSVVGLQTISIGSPLTGATISGPITVSQNIPHAYRVSAEPVTATLPFDYFWYPEPAQGQATNVATYTVADLGEHLINAYVNNPIGLMVTGTHRIVSVPPLTVGTIDGPITGRPFITLMFTATTQPADAAPPLSYAWSPAPLNGQGTAQAKYQWAASGTKDISVTISNDSGSVVGLQTISIESANIYLPLLRKG